MRYRRRLTPSYREFDVIYTVRNGLIVPKREIIKPIAPARLRRRLPDTRRLRFPHVWVPVYIPETMAVAFDAKATSVTSSTGTNATETNSSLTIGASATLLIAFVNIADSTIPLPAACSGVTWNSVAMTLLGTKNDAGTSGGQTQVNVYGLVNPATGNHSLVASFTGRTGNTGVYLDGASWTGSDTSSLATAVPSANIILDVSVVAPGTGNYPALGPFAVTTASGDAAVAVANTWPGASPTMLTGTLLHSSNPENGLQIEGYNLASGASTNVQFNNMPGAQTACGIAFRIVQAGSTPAAATVASSVLSMMGVG